VARFRALEGQAALRWAFSPTRSATGRFRRSSARERHNPGVGRCRDGVGAMLWLVHSLSFLQALALCIRTVRSNPGGMPTWSYPRSGIRQGHEANWDQTTLPPDTMTPPIQAGYSPSKEQDRRRRTGHRIRRSFKAGERICALHCNGILWLHDDSPLL